MDNEIYVQLPKKISGEALSDIVYESAKGFFKANISLGAFAQNKYILTSEGLRIKPDRRYSKIGIRSDYYFSKAMANFFTCWACSFLILPPLLSPWTLIYAGQHVMDTREIYFDECYNELIFQRTSINGRHSFEYKFKPIFEKYLSEVVRRVDKT